MTVLEARGVSFNQKDKSIIRNIGFQLKKGELLGLVGPNGAGKSTLLRCLAGFYTPSAGEIELLGRGLTSYKPRERARNLSYITQENSQAFDFTVLEVLMMGAYAQLGYWQPPGKETEEEARRALRFVGLENLAGQSFPLLSGGEKQLVLFARTLVQDSRVLLMDEPTANLDIKHEQNLLSMTRELCSEGRSALVSIHNLDRAAEFCDRIILLDRGSIAAVGTPEQVLSRDNLEGVYQTPLHVSRNASTGAIGIAPRPSLTPSGKETIHLIGGAGSAVNLSRKLHMAGYGLSGGIAHGEDSDSRLWKSMGVEFIEVPPFAEIEDVHVQQAAELQSRADLTVLCCFPLGIGNWKNLELSEKAENLIILEGKRDLFSLPSEAAEIYSRLQEKHPLVPEDEILDYLTQFKRKN